MLYTVSKYKKEIILGIILFSTPFLIPLYGTNLEVGTLVSAISTIFAIFTGFLIADAMANYLRLQSLIAEENSALIIIAENAEQIDKNGSALVYQAIDEYMIKQLDLDTLNHFSQTQKQVDNLHHSIHQLKIESEDSMIYDHILSMEEKIMSARQEMALAAKETLSFIHWVTLIGLATLVAISMLMIRDGGWLMNTLAGLIIVSTEAILVILRDMDNNRLLERKLSYQNPQEVFHAIKKPPYYPFMSPIKSRTPGKDGQLRVGKKPQDQG